MCDMYIYIYKSRKDEEKYIFELFNQWEDKLPNCRLLNELDYYLDDIVQFNNFNQIIEFVVDLKDSIIPENKKSIDAMMMPYDARIDSRTYYYFNGLNDKVLKQKIIDLIK